MKPLESYLISSLIVDPDSVPVVRDILPAESLAADFQRLYQKILDLDEAGAPVDRVALYLSSVAPEAKLDKIFSVEEGVILDAERFARLIKQRNLQAEFKEAAEDRDPERGKEVVEELLTVEQPPEWMELGQVSDKDREGDVLKTGFYGLDYFVELRQTDLVILSGLPGIGKSTLGMNIFCSLSRRHPVGMISFEMGQRGIAQRRDLSLGSCDADIARNCLVSFPSAFNLSTVRRVTRDMVSKRGIKAILVDYLQLMSETKRFNSRHLEISYITRQLKQLAKEFNVMVMLVASLNRGIDARAKAGVPSRPLLSDLKESGDIEYAAEVVLFLYRADDKLPATELIVAKNRYGRKGKVDLVFMPERALYGDTDTRHNVADARNR